MAAAAPAALDHVLTNRGYSIKKSALSDSELDEIRKELTVKPIGMPKFAQAAQAFTLYAESPARIYVPRIWGRDRFGPAEADLVPAGKPLRPELAFTGKPFDYQERIVSDFVGVGGNGLICVPCGRGKTFMALAIAARLRKRFLVIVDKEFLMEQWRGEMERFFPGLRIGILQGDTAELGQTIVKGKELSLAELKERARVAGLKVSGTKTDLQNRLAAAGINVIPSKEIVEYDCTICMIQTLLSRDFTPGQFNDYGLTIFDECHHLGASYFSQVLLKVQTRYMLGLSATPERDDGLTKVFLWFLGEPVYWEKVRDPDPTVKVRPLFYTSTDDAYTRTPTDWKGEVSLVHLLGQVVEWAPRTRWLAEKLVEVAADARRKILVLSERITLLEALDAHLTRAGLKTGYYIGGMKDSERADAARDSQVLLGTYAMASEGMNIKELNCVLLASPRKKIEQSIGRILRVKPEERVVEPLILDCVDVHDVYKGQWAKRKAFYKKCQYDIEGESGAAAAKKKKEADADVCQIELDES